MYPTRWHELSCPPAFALHAPQAVAGGRAHEALSPQVCLKFYEHELVELACQCPAVVCCRCSPTQKAHIVKLLQQHTGRRTCAIGECPSREQAAEGDGS